MVIEKPYDYIAQLDASMEWLNDKIHFESDDAFTLRRNMVAWKDSHDIKLSSKSRHSSEVNKKPLSQKAIDNIVRFHHEDYKVLREMKEFVCKSEVCRGAIASILERREDSLEKIPIGDNSLVVQSQTEIS